MSKVLARMEVDKAALRRVRYKMRRMSTALRSKLGRAAVRQTLKPVRQEIKGRLPKRTGNLRRALQYKLKQKKGNIFGRVLFKRKGKYAGRHAHLVEYGTEQHKVQIKKKKTLSDGKSYFGKSVVVPRIPGKYIVTSTFDRRKSAMVHTMTTELRAGIHRLAK